MYENVKNGYREFDHSGTLTSCDNAMATNLTSLEVDKHLRPFTKGVLGSRKGPK